MKEKFNIYISCPQQTPFEQLLIYKGLIESKAENIRVKYWDRIQYNPNLMNECESFAIMLPNNKWNYHIEDLPSGCKKEVLNAIKESHELLLCYKSLSGYNIYKAEVSNGVISGIAGTSDVLNQRKYEDTSIGAYGKQLKKSDFQIKELDSYITHLPSTNPDPRLLLLM